MRPARNPAGRPIRTWPQRSAMGDFRSSRLAQGDAMTLKSAATAHMRTAAYAVLRTQLIRAHVRPAT